MAKNNNLLSNITKTNKQLIKPTKWNEKSQMQ